MISRMLVSARVNRPWVVRTVALLLVLVGLQAGAFRDLPTHDERYYGAEDYGVAVAPESAKPHALPPAEPVAQLPHAPYRAFAMPPALVGAAAAHAFHLPDPTGPPRA